VKFLPELSSSVPAAVFELLLGDDDQTRIDSTAAVAAVSTLLLDGGPP